MIVRETGFPVPSKTGHVTGKEHEIGSEIFKELLPNESCVITDVVMQQVRVRLSRLCKANNEQRIYIFRKIAEKAGGFGELPNTVFRNPLRF